MTCYASLSEQFLSSVELVYLTITFNFKFHSSLFKTHQSVYGTRLIAIHSQSLCDPLVAPRFEFVARQAAWGRLRDADADVQLRAEGGENGPLHFGEGATAVGFDLKEQIVHLRHPSDLHFIFDDGRDGADQIVNRARIDVDSTYAQHIVSAPEHSALDTRKSPPAFARFGCHLHQVAGAITQHWHSRATERGDDQLAARAFFDRFAGLRIDDLEYELKFVEVDCAVFGLAIESPGADFGRAGVVEAPRPPRLFDPSLDVRHARARFARVNRDANVGGAQVDSEASGDLGQMQRVGRCAEQDCAAVIEDRAQPLFGTHPAARNGKRAGVPRALDSRPVTDIRPEGEGAEDKIVFCHARPPIDFDPAPQKRLPVLGGIEPPERAAGRPRRLVQIAVARERVSEESAVRRMFELFCRQFAFGREGQRAQIRRPASLRHFYPSKAEFLLVKLISRQFRQ